MKLFNKLRHLVRRSSGSSHHSDTYSDASDTDSCSSSTASTTGVYTVVSEIRNPSLRLRVLQKVRDEWLPRTLVLRFDTNGECHIYIIAHCQYSYYEVYNASTNFIRAIYDANDKYCTLVLQEAILRFKMESKLQKLKLVAYISENLDVKGWQMDGVLTYAPDGKYHKKNTKVILIVRGSMLLIIDRASLEIIRRESLPHIGVMSCDFQTSLLYYTNLRQTEIPINNQNYVAVSIPNIHLFWEFMTNHRLQHCQRFKFLRA
ncbi:unnamed protein product [Caenorhabditis bovis]|uniref:Uncharacterized protein n=1 Tax=Caenorhabditis bovis TaxID=2654633 RepID=A0A8S1F2R9_9PELO|nr:unnamed protein product [Caenorhabditis bovis]